MSGQHSNGFNALAPVGCGVPRHLPKGKLRGASVVLAATLAMAMGFGGLGLITVFMAPMEADLGWTRSETSFGYALSTAGMAVGGLFWGRHSDRVDVRALLSIGIIGMVGSLLTMSTLKSLPVFYMAHVILRRLRFLRDLCIVALDERRVVSGAARFGDGPRYRRRRARAGLAALLRESAYQCIWLAIGVCRRWLLASRGA